MNKNRRRSIAGILGIAIAVLLTYTAAGQFLQLGQPDRIELTAPQLETVASATQARLEQAHALAGGKNWDEAINILRELSALADDRIIAVTKNRYTNLSAYCQLELTRLPREALTRYRQQVDPAAEAWCRKGIRLRDAQQLQRVVDKAFVSSWGDEALSALGELALERGDYPAARRAWEQLSPLTRDPNGVPLWLALRKIDLDAHGEEVRRRWFDRPELPAWLAYPDTDRPLADILARLILVSIREENFERAELELDILRRWFPEAQGRLAGRDDANHAAALAEILASAGSWLPLPPALDWPTFAGAPTRERIAPTLKSTAGWAWEKPVAIDRAPSLTNADSPATFRQRPSTVQIDVPPAHFPIVVNGVVVYGSDLGVYAIELATGKPAITKDGVLYRAELTRAEAEPAVAPATVWGQPRYSLSADGSTVYARVGPSTTGIESTPRNRARNYLVGLDLARDGLLTFRATPKDDWSFAGAPIANGDEIFVALYSNGVRAESAVACYDAVSGRLKWNTLIAAGNSPASGRGPEFTCNLLALAGDTIFCSTNLGAIAAIDAASGRIQWLQRYERTGGLRIGQGPEFFGRDLSPPVYHAGLVFVAPSDTPNVFCFDATTGLLLWANKQPEDASHLLGVVGDKLIAGGDRIWALDVASGVTHYVWPESRTAGIRGIGHGLLAGAEVFWPTRNRIYILDADTGSPSRKPIELLPVSRAGANLMWSDGYLVAVGPDKMQAIAPAGKSRPPQKRSLQLVLHSAL